MKTRLLAFATILCLLALAILATIYLAWLCYPLEISWQKLDQVVYMKPNQIMANVNILMNYLTNPFSRQLNMPDFPSSKSGLKHFADVKHLFHLAQLLFIVLLYPAYRFIKEQLKKKSLWFYQRDFVVAALFPLSIGFLGFFFGFDRFFTLFHQLLFPGDSSWLFNPYTDSVIYILPETFFMHCFLLFLVLYELLMLTMIWLAKSTTPKERYTNETV